MSSISATPYVANTQNIGNNSMLKIIDDFEIDSELTVNGNIICTGTTTSLKGFYGDLYGTAETTTKVLVNTTTANINYFPIFASSIPDDSLIYGNSTDTSFYYNAFSKILGVYRLKVDDDVNIIGSCTSPNFIGDLTGIADSSEQVVVNTAVSGSANHYLLSTNTTGASVNLKYISNVYFTPSINALSVNGNAAVTGNLNTNAILATGNITSSAFVTGSNLFGNSIYAGSLFPAQAGGNLTITNQLGRNTNIGYSGYTNPNNTPYLGERVNMLVPMTLPAGNSPHWTKIPMYQNSYQTFTINTTQIANSGNCFVGMSGQLPTFHVYKMGIWIFVNIPVFTFVAGSTNQAMFYLNGDPTYAPSASPLYPELLPANDISFCFRLNVINNSEWRVGFGNMNTTGRVTLSSIYNGLTFGNGSNFAVGGIQFCYMSNANFYGY